MPLGCVLHAFATAYMLGSEESDSVAIVKQAACTSIAHMLFMQCAETMGCDSSDVARRQGKRRGLHELRVGWEGRDREGQEMGAVGVGVG